MEFLFRLLYKLIVLILHIEQEPSGMHIATQKPSVIIIVGACCSAYIIIHLVLLFG